MLTQIASLYPTFQVHIQKFIRNHYQRISAVSMAVKILAVFVFFSTIPMNTNQVNRVKYETAAKIETSNPNVLTSGSRQVSIETGQANIDAQNQVAASRQIAYDSAGIERDPTYFKGLYQAAASRYGIPWQVLAAVHYVETGSSDSTSETSYAGATGPMQFMPGTWRAYAVDGDGDGSADITNVNDAVYGAANLLAAGGAAEGNVDAALFNYNHSQRYVDTVKEVAGSIQ